MNLAGYLGEEIAKIPKIVSKQYSEARSSGVQIRGGWATGSGDSFAAALALQYMSGFSFTAVDPLELCEASVAGVEQLVAISVKGRTVKVVETSRFLADRGVEVIAVTSSASSPLATIANRVVKLVYGGGQYPVGVGNYSAVIAALGALSGQPIDGVWEAYRAALGAPLPELAEEVVAVGEFEGYVNALFTCLKLYEASCLPCRFYRAEQFMHAPIYSLGEKAAVLVFASSTGGYAGRISEVLEKSGCRCVFLDFGGGMLGNLVAGAAYAARLAKAYVEKGGWEKPCFTSKRAILYESTRSIYY